MRTGKSQGYPTKREHDVEQLEFQARLREAILSNPLVSEIQLPQPETKPVPIEPEAGSAATTTEHDFSNFRLRLSLPKPEHSFEPRGWIEADSAEFGGCRVLDLPDAGELDQQQFGHWAARVMNQHAQLMTEREKLRAALRDCVESLKRLPDVDDAYRLTVLRQAQAALAGDEQGGERR